MEHNTELDTFMRILSQLKTEQSSAYDSDLF